MIGSNEKNVTRRLASVVDGLDGLVGGSDGLDGGVVDSGVSDLEEKRNENAKVSELGSFRSFPPFLGKVGGLTISGGAKLHMMNLFESKTKIQSQLELERTSDRTPNETRRKKHSLELISLHNLSDLISDGLDRHLRLLVVSGDLWRRDHVSNLVLELLLDSSAAKTKRAALVRGKRGERVGRERREGFGTNLKKKVMWLRKGRGRRAGSRRSALGLREGRGKGELTRIFEKKGREIGGREVSKADLVDAEQAYQINSLLSL